MGEVHVDDASCTAGLGSDTGAARVAEQVESRPPHPGAQEAASDAQVQKELGILAFVVSVDEKLLPLLTAPYGSRRVGRVEQKLRLSAPHDEVFRPQLASAPGLDFRPGLRRQLPVEMLQQSERAVAVQGHSRPALHASVKTAEAVGPLRQPARNRVATPRQRLIEKLEKSQYFSPTKLPLATFFFFAKSSGRTVE